MCKVSHFSVTNQENPEKILLQSVINLPMEAHMNSMTLSSFGGLTLLRQEEEHLASLTWVHVLKVRFRHLGQIGARAFGYDTVSGRFVGTADDNMTLQERDRTDWSYREAQQQQFEFDEPEEPVPEDDLPF